jgi:thiol-disulfide isomerase/thioredoxin
MLLPVVILCAVASTLAARQKLTPLDEAVYKRVVASHNGKVLLVDFWATWCSPCLEELPLLVKLEAKYRKRGLSVVTVSCDEPEEETKALEVLKQHKAPPGYRKRVNDDEKFINSVDPKWSGALPGLFLYDHNGRLVKSFIGETDMAALEKAIRQLLAG